MGGTIRTRLVRVVRARRTRPSDPATAVERVETHLAEQARVLAGARRSLGELTVSRRRAEILAARAAEEADGAGRLAAAAVTSGDDAAARRHLADAVAAERRRDSQRETFRRLDAQVRHLAGQLDLLQQQIAEAETQARALRDDRDAARAALAVHDQLAAPAPVTEARTHARRLQAEARARDELAWTDPDSPQVRAAFAELETTIAAHRAVIRGPGREGAGA